MQEAISRLSAELLAEQPSLQSAIEVQNAREKELRDRLAALEAKLQELTNTLHSPSGIVAQMARIKEHERQALSRLAENTKLLEDLNLLNEVLLFFLPFSPHTDMNVCFRPSPTQVPSRTMCGQPEQPCKRAMHCSPWSAILVPLYTFVRLE